MEVDLVNGVLDRLKKKMMEEEMGEVVVTLVEKLDRMILLLEKIEKNTQSRKER